MIMNKYEYYIQHLHIRDGCIAVCYTRDPCFLLLKLLSITCSSDSLTLHIGSSAGQYQKLLS